MIHEFTTPEMRLLPLAGGNNLRDMGGYTAANGRIVKSGMLLRSGTLAELTDEDWRYLVDVVHVQTLCDLRTDPERSEKPFAAHWLKRIVYRTHAYDATFADLRRTMESGLATPQEARAAMLAGYTELPFALAPAYRQLFAALLKGEVPLLFNCTGGKDRTGLGAALVLGALGVPRETLIEDYLLTNKLRRWPDWVKQSGEIDDRTKEIRRAVLFANADYLTAALDSIDFRHGSLGSYFETQLGLSSADVSALQGSLLR